MLAGGYRDRTKENSISCSISTGPSQRHLVATSTTLQYEWFGDWELCIGVTSIKATWKRRASTAHQSQVAIQVAPVRVDKPNSPVLIGTLVQGDGETCTGVVDISTNTSATYWVRVGVAYSATSATVGQADVSLQATMLRCGGSLGNQAFSLAAYSATAAYQPLTGWLPALDVATIKAAIVITGIIGNFRCRLAFRTADTSPEAPNAWSTTFATEYSANGEYPLADTAVTGTGGAMWIQLGIQFYLSTGSALGQATVGVALSGKS